MRTNGDKNYLAEYLFKNDLIECSNKTCVLNEHWEELNRVVKFYKDLTKLRFASLQVPT